jgi:glutathione S-transferase
MRFSAIRNLRQTIVEQSNLRLYVDAQLASPYAMSAFVALSEKDLPFEVTRLDLANNEHQETGFARKSITRRVPTLQHGAFFLSESSAIAEYVDESFSGVALYPKESRCRARARQVQAWLRSDLMPIRQERSTEVIFYGARSKPLSAAALEAAQKLCSAAHALLPPGEEYVCGRWSIADVDLALMLNRLALHGDPLPERLVAYATRQWQRPSVQAWLNQARPPL